MKLRSKFHGNPFNNCRNISLKTTNVNLIMAEEKRSAGHQSSIHPLGTKNVCTKCANHSIWCWDILVVKWKLWPAMALYDKSNDHQSHQTTSSGDHEWLMAIRQIVILNRQCRILPTKVKIGRTSWGKLNMPKKYSTFNFKIIPGICSTSQVGNIYCLQEYMLLSDKSFIFLSLANPRLGLVR